MDCNLRIKGPLKGTVYYKCEKDQCKNDCVVYVLWEYIEGEETGPDGKKVVKGFNVVEVGCECTMYRGGRGDPGTAKPCSLEVGLLPDPVKKNGKEYKKSLVTCVSNHCRQECVFYIKYKDPTKEFGEIESIGCDCVDWAALR